MSTERSHWGSRMAFILAAAGSAVGLGNIWKFPYITGINGGGAFVLVYLICIAAVGFPILIAEVYVGQKAQKNSIEAFDVLDKKNSLWQLPGWFGLIAAFMILSFYSVVAGWVLDFLMKSVTNSLGSNTEEIKGAFGLLLEGQSRQIVWHTVFMAITIGIVIGGVKNGLERAAKLLMPTLFAILIVMLLYCFTLDGFGPAMSFLFSPDFSKLSAASVLEAVGHSFFTLSLGMGVMLTYGSYLSKKESLPKVAFALAALDTIVALAAGIVIFSVVFTFGGEPGGGPGLIFSTLPVLFSQMTGGYILSIIFFLLVAFAAITSAVSILEVVVAYVHEKYELNRAVTTIVSGIAIYLVGLFCVPGFSDFKVMNLGLFDFFDKASANYLLPIGGMLISLFFGWKLGEKATTELFGSGAAAKGFLITTRFIAPLAVLVMVYNAVAEAFGLPKVGG